MENNDVFRDDAVETEGDNAVPETPPIPQPEIWLHENPDAMAAVQKGLSESAAGQITPPEDFRRFADISDEAETQNPK